MTAEKVRRSGGAGNFEEAACSARRRAAALDAADPLAPFHARFALPPGVVYLDGNSLGPPPLAALAAVEAAARREWASGLIASWNEAGWFDLPEALGARIAPLLGARPGEVVVCDTVTLNLYKLLHAALALQSGRPEILMEARGFHTDRYVAAAVADGLPGRRLRLVPDAAELAAAVGPETAVMLVDHVDYRTGELRDMAALSAAAHRAGALVIWDLCHSAGIMPLALDAAGVDFAVGCTYKYLNGGPGAPAFLFCAERHLGRAVQPVAGWWAHAAPFAFETAFRPAEGVRRFLTGTPPVLSMRALAGALAVFEEVDLAAVRRKSEALTTFFIELVEGLCAGQGVTLASPREPARRGSQVSLRHAQAWPVMQALIAEGIVGDFRAPDVLRFGFAPLYVRFADVATAALTLARVLASGRWREPRFAARKAVT